MYLSHTAYILEHTDIKVVNLFLHLLFHLVDDGLVGKRHEREVLLVAGKEEQAPRGVDEIAVVVVGASAIAELKLVNPRRTPSF